MRVPDVAVAGMHGDTKDEKEFRVGPDLCVEILSPTNTRAEMAEKKAAYLAAGAREVWL